VLGELKEPVNLYFYFSRERPPSNRRSSCPTPRACASSSRSVGPRQRQGAPAVVDPQPFSDDEDRAAELGLQALQANGGDALYFGLAGTNSTDGRSAIPTFQADREEFLEYDVAKLIHELGTPKKPVIGLLSSLPMQGQFNPMTGQMGDPWPIYTQLEQLFTCAADPDVDHIDKDVDVLMVVQPKQLPPKTLYAIDQFVMRGGKMLLFVDPNSGADQRPGSLQSHGRAMANHSSDLEPLLAAWGVDYDPTKVIGDMSADWKCAPRMQCAARASHRHSRSAPRRHESQGCGDPDPRIINMATAGSLSARPAPRPRSNPCC
jgi:ABC-type uncharacterized transport system involved in gliding motility auxiliary subunit